VNVRGRVAFVLAVVALTAAGGTAVADVDALVASERPDGGWGFAHRPGRRATPYTWLVKAAERIAAPFGLATWDVVAIRSPGTPAAGLLLVEDGSAIALEAARRAGDLLVATQLAMGGWPSELPVHGRELPGWYRLLATRPAVDDDVTPGAIRFLLALWRATGDVAYRTAAERAIDMLLREQHPSGGWPLVGRPGWIHRLRPGSFVQLAVNDGATPLAITTLLDAADALDRPELRAAAIRGAEWLVTVRGAAPAWAQQYDETGSPVGARRFEVPALATWETRHAIDALLDVARRTNDARFCAPHGTRSHGSSGSPWRRTAGRASTTSPASSPSGWTRAGRASPTRTPRAPATRGSASSASPPCSHASAGPRPRASGHHSRAIPAPAQTAAR
jgi:hypothetical protein